MSDFSSSLEQPSQSFPQKALAVAKSKLGMKEEGGPNQGPIVEWSMRPWTKAPLGNWAKWCAGFVCTCYLEAGSPLIRKYASLEVSKLWSKLDRAGYTWDYIPTPSQKLPEPGDLFFTKGFSHVGLVESVEGNILHTVEGNHQDQVARAQRSLTSVKIHGFARLL